MSRTTLPNALTTYYPITRSLKMQKRIIALAITGLVSGAAFAQRNVTIYGIADMSYVNFSDGNASGQGGGRIDSGQWKTSRFGLRGSEELGNGLSAIFQQEFGLDMDVNGGPTKQRPSWVGLKSNDLGEIRGGNFNTFEDDLLVATSTMLEYGTIASPKYVYIETAGGEPRNMISNAVFYNSPIWSGFRIKAGYSSHASNSPDTSSAQTAATGANGNNRVIAAAIHYSNGPLIAGATYEYNKAQSYTTGGARVSSPDSGNTWNLAASYDFGVARLSGAYGTINYGQNPGATNPGATINHRKQWQIGASAPITPKDLISINYARATISYNDSRPTWDDDSIGFWGIGYQHSLSKRTTLYAAYGDINQDDSNQTRASLASTPPVSGTTANAFEQAFAFGIRHNF